MIKRVGVITYHDGINYGAFWQVKCLSQCIEALGFDVSVVDYKSKKLTYEEFKSLFFTKNIVLIFRNIVKLIRFRISQRSAYCLISPDRVAELDCIVYGSDEIWNFNNPLINYDAYYFGGHQSSATKLLSYAPSFGTVSLEEEFPAGLMDNLKKMSTVTCRDINSYEILKNMGIKSKAMVVDPTLISNIPVTDLKQYNNCILIYTTFLPPVIIDELKVYCLLNKKRLVAIGYQVPGVESHVTLSPENFVSAINSCSYVVTTMFHGVMFSIKFKKQFVIYNDSYRKNKLAYALKHLDLEGQYFEKIDSTTFDSREIDYEKINPKLNSWIKNSLNTLKEAIGG